MNLKNIIENIDKSDKNSEWVCLMTIGEREFDIFNIDHDPDNRLKCYWYAKWMCTDSYVGGRVYFLDDKPVAVTWQTGRKSNEVFYWMNKSSRKKVKKYLESLTYNDDNDQQATYLTKKDLEADLDIGYTIEYSGGLFEKEIIHVETKEKVKVLKTYNAFEDIDKWRLVKVEFPNGDKKEVELKDILIPYFVKS